MNDEYFKKKKQEFVSGAVHQPKRRQKWVDIGTDAIVMEWIDSHYTIEVEAAGVGLKSRNGKIAEAHKEDLIACLLKLLRQGSWEVIKEGQVKNLVPFNLTPKESAIPPWRLINNAMKFNEHIKRRWKVKYEGLQTLAMVLRQGDWGFTLDLKDGYYALWLAEISRGLLAGRVEVTAKMAELLVREGLATWEQMRMLPDGGYEVFLQPKGLVMGFTNSCAIFTKLTRQVAKYWRKKGVRLVHLMDDFSFFAATYLEAIKLRDEVLKDLEELGFYVSWGKSLMKPSQRWKFLGFIIDTILMRKFVPAEKIEEVEKLVRIVLEDNKRDKSPVIRQLMKITGKVVSFGHGILAARLLTRETYRIIRPVGGDYDAQVEVTQRALDELAGMLTELRAWNKVGVPVRREMRMTDVRVTIDAGKNVGFVIDGQKRDMVLRDEQSVVKAIEFSEEESNLWQVQKELLAVLKMLEEEAVSLRNKRVLVRTDCKGVERALHKGMSRSDTMTTMLKRVWDVCLRHGIQLTAEWTPGKAMVVAGVDGVSRQHEFKLRGEWFSKWNGDRGWGRRSTFKGYGMDLFASRKTRQGQMPYCQRGGEGESVGDARTVQMDPSILYWVVPPLSVTLIEAVLQRLQQARVAATVIVPRWKGQPYYTWLKEQAEGEVEAVKWTSWPATFLDVSEKTPKPHLVNRWQFVRVNLDFRSTQETWVEKHRLQGEDWGKRPVRVLSLCDGMGGTKMALDSLGLESEVLSLEKEEQPRAVALARPGTRGLWPCEIEQWAGEHVTDEE